jgi:hypothetical protein
VEVIETDHCLLDGWRKLCLGQSCVESAVSSERPSPIRYCSEPLAFLPFRATGFELASDTYSVSLVGAAFRFGRRDFFPPSSRLMSDESVDWTSMVPAYLVSTHKTATDGEQLTY